MGKYFGTDGVRGVANEELTALMAFKIGQYLGYNYKGKNIVIGCDTRKSKDMFESALCAGITSGGANAYVLKVTTTPCVSYLTKTADFICGIMISASHNPFYDNGIKIFNENGEKIDDKLELAIEDYIDDKITIELAKSEEIGLVVEYSDKIEKYLDYLVSTVNIDLSSFNILVDCANGSASHLAAKLLDKLAIKADIVANNPDGVNINVKCGSTHLENLKKHISKGKYDLAVAFDGDADRMLAIDRNGNNIDGDLIMYVCAKALKNINELNDNTLVTTVMSNIGLYKALDKIGISYEKTAVGDKYVYENMLNNNFSLGGEQSGHIIFKKYASTGDGLLTMIQFLAAIKTLNQTIDDLLEEVKIYPQLLKNVRVKDKDLVLNSKLLADEVAKVENELSTDGRVLLRASGTEPLIRVMVEASSDELCEKHVSHLIDIVQSI